MDGLDIHNLPNGLHVFPEGTPPPIEPGHWLAQLTLEPAHDTATLIATVQQELTACADGALTTSEIIERLSAAGEAIGQQDDTETGSMLRAAAANHASAEHALRAARATRGKTRDQALRRLELLEELDRLRARQEQLQTELQRGTLAVRGKRLEEARALAKQLSETTQRCFALSALREFPLDQEAALQRADRRAAEASEAYESSSTALEAIVEKLEAEQTRFQSAGGEWLQALPDEWETRLAESDEKVAEAQASLDAATTAHDEIAQRLEDAERALRHLPDFGQFAGDPMEWVNQITTTFATNVRLRNSERALRDELLRALEKRESTIASPRSLFLEGEAGILNHARNLDRTGDESHKKAGELAEEEQTLQSIYREVEASIPGFRGMAALMAIATPALGFITFATRNPGLIYALGGVALALAFFSFSFFRARRNLTRIRLRLNETGPEAERARAKAADCRASLDDLLRGAGVSSVRELEAMYERYCDDKAAAEAVAQELTVQEEKTTETENHTAALFANLQATFESIGEDIVEESDIPEAAKRALSSYQQYRDAKRRRAESRDLLQRRAKELEDAKAALAIATQEDVKRSLQAREHLRRAGFEDEKKHAGALHAFRAYRLRHAQQRTQYGRIELMEERRRMLAHKVESTQRSRDEALHTLERLLTKAGVDSLEAWFQRAEEARAYREAWSERTRLQEALDALLDGETMEALASEIEAAGSASDFDRSPETIQSELESVCEAIDHALEEAESLGQRMGKGGIDRTLNELEEDEAAAREILSRLTAERRAIGHASAAIQDAARTRRAALADYLAEPATQWLQRLTGRTDATITIAADLAPRIEGSVPHAGLVALAVRFALLDALESEDARTPLVIRGELPLDGPATYEQVLAIVAQAGTLRPVLWCVGPAAWADAAHVHGLSVREPLPASGD